MVLSVLLTTYAVVLLLELPDKTMIATLVLSSRYRPAPVIVGVAAAFGLQMLLAVTAGQLLTLLPDDVTIGVAAALFAIGAILLFRESRRSNREGLHKSTPVARSFWQIAAISFGILFIAEFGDGSQLAAAGLAARYGAPIAVFLGAWLAELTVCTLAAFAGQALLRVVPVQWIQRIAAGVFTAFALIGVWEIVT